MAVEERLATSQPDTIAAIATAWGEAGIAIVRTSGPLSGPLGLSLLGLEGLPERRMRLATLRDEDGAALDQVLVVRFAAPRSYTGEDMLEVHTHGGLMAARICLELMTRRGARLAEPGEFTRRAVLNGRMDLSQAEGTLGLIQARSAEALKAAARTLQGGLSAPAREAHAALLDLQAVLEAGLDFPEGEPPTLSGAELSAELEAVGTALESLENRCSVGALLQDGVRVVIAGRPNGGKSSLLNALLGRGRAIVAETPGTTRDTLEEPITLRGVPIRLTDTAGLRGAAGDPVEALGMERAQAALEGADIRLWVLDGSRPMGEGDREALERLGPEGIAVLNKSDLPQALTRDEVQALAPQSRVLSVSAKTGTGLEALKEAILGLALGSGALEGGLNASARQLEEVRATVRAVADARSALAGGMGLDVVAGLLGLARLSLERLLGLSGDVLLDAVFSRFCVGK